MFKYIHFKAKQTLVLGFSIIILMGTFLLMLPVSNRNGEVFSFLNALFTSASATCVTGLVVCDTWTQFTVFGQVVIMFLIQIGGLGFMTFAILFSKALGKRIGLKERSYLMEAINAIHLSDVVRLFRRILLGTLVFESVGAILLSIRFCPEFGLAKGIWYGVFHSVSAFSNAGFDLMGYLKPYTSLTPYADDIIINITIIGLVLVGGIGFVVWDDIVIHKWKFKNFNLHTKVMLSFTGVLIVVSAGLMLVLEKDTTFAGMNTTEKVLASLFQVMTPRTAGFNTIDTAALSEGGSFLTMLLMVIGAGPGSTAGGIKITTFAVILLSMLTNVFKRGDINLFNRRLGDDLVKRAFSSTAFYLILTFCGCLIILAVQDLPVKDTIFEALSAIGTVGLTTGITRKLLPISRIVIIVLMYSGRIGSFTMFMAFTENKNIVQVRNPVEKIIVG